MAKIWRLPNIETFIPTGKEWLLHALANLSDLERCVLLMIFWRGWYVRNELVHSKPAPPMDVSIRFLQSYMESLMTVKSNSCCDPAKGKMAIVLDGATKHTSAAVGALPTWSSR